MIMRSIADEIRRLIRENSRALGAGLIGDLSRLAGAIEGDIATDAADIPGSICQVCGERARHDGIFTYVCPNQHWWRG